jgi:hypothetical protein
MIRQQRYVRLYNYYTSQNLPPDNVEQPLAINYFKAICDKHNSYLWGQWQNDIVQWRVKPRQKSGIAEDDASITIKDYLTDLLNQCDKNALLHDASLNCSVFGDGVLRLRWDAFERRVVVESILPEWFHCRWDINNFNRLSEVIVSYPIDRMDAEERYGTSGSPQWDYNMINPEYLPGFTVYWEHWTPTSYRRWIADSLIAEGPNPYMQTGDDGTLYPGIIPFIHIPNMRVGGEFFGFSDAENILYLQDELNRKMADMGDTVNNFAHPIVTLKNFVGSQANLPVGPDAVWDLGVKGEAELLEWKGTPPEVMAYIQLVKEMMYDTAMMPEVAFGRGVRGGGGGGSSGGSGRGASGIALQMAMMPVVEASTKKRIFWDIALKQLAQTAILIHAVEDPATLPFNVRQLRNYEVAPVFAPVLPRDRLQTVNEVVARTNSLTMSITRALEVLGEESIVEEDKRIRADARFKANLGLLAMPKPGGKNSDRGQGGSSSQQNGPGASNAKPGSPAKSA